MQLPQRESTFEFLTRHENELLCRRKWVAHDDSGQPLTLDMRMALEELSRMEMEYGC